MSRAAARARILAAIRETVMADTAQRLAICRVECPAARSRSISATRHQGYPWGIGPARRAKGRQRAVLAAFQGYSGKLFSARL